LFLKRGRLSFHHYKRYSELTLNPHYEIGKVFIYLRLGVLFFLIILSRRFIDADFDELRGGEEEEELRSGHDAQNLVVVLQRENLLLSDR